MTRAAILSLVMLVSLPSAAAAQVYFGGSVTWTSGYDAGDQSAFETPNSSTGAPPLTLFTTSSKMRAAGGVEAQLGFYLSRSVAVEGFFRVSRPTLETRLDDDFENAEPTTADERATSYLAGGTLLYHFGRGALVPFVSGGGGYLRELHEDNAAVLTGAEIHAGGGLHYWLGKGRHRFGLRVDAQVSSRSKSIGFEDKRRVLPIVGAGLTYRF